MSNRNRGKISRRRFISYSSVSLLAAWPGIVGPSRDPTQEMPW